MSRDPVSPCRDAHKHSYAFTILDDGRVVSMDGTDEAEAAKKVKLIFPAPVTQVQSSVTGTIYNF